MPEKTIASIIALEGRGDEDAEDLPKNIAVWFLNSAFGRAGHDGD